MLCFVLALEFQSKALGSISISLSLSLVVSHSLSLSLPLSLYSFCSGHNIDCDNGIFLGFAFLAVVCYFCL